MHMRWINTHKSLFGPHGRQSKRTENSSAAFQEIQSNLHNPIQAGSARSALYTVSQVSIFLITRNFSLQALYLDEWAFCIQSLPSCSPGWTIHHRSDRSPTGRRLVRSAPPCFLLQTVDLLRPMRMEICLQYIPKENDRKKKHLECWSGRQDPRLILHQREVQLNFQNFLSNHHHHLLTNRNLPWGSGGVPTCNKPASEPPLNTLFQNREDVCGISKHLIISCPLEGSGLRSIWSANPWLPYDEVVVEGTSLFFLCSLLWHSSLLSFRMEWRASDRPDIMMMSVGPGDLLWIQGWVGPRPALWGRSSSLPSPPGKPRQTGVSPGTGDPPLQSPPDPGLTLTPFSPSSSHFYPCCHPSQ